MDEKHLRKTIGSRTKSRRKQLKLSQSYLADKLGVNKSTIQRYESGAIDNTKHLIVESLATALHVTPEYLRGETDDLKSEISNRRTLEIFDAMEQVKSTIPLGIPERENEFSETMLLLLLKSYLAFTEHFSRACRWYTEHDSPMLPYALDMGYESKEELEQESFNLEFSHTANTYYELSDILRRYARNPELARSKLEDLFYYL